MNSIFTSNRLLPTLKRRSRSNSKPDIPAAKGKPLDILPDLSEEDEGRPSLSSVSSVNSASPYRRTRTMGGSTTLGNRLSVAERKRDSRRVVLTGAEGLTFEDFFPTHSAPSRPPRPPFKPDAACESPLDDINLRFSGLGISLDFPSPPLDIINLANTNSSPSPQRGHSPTPSMLSNDTSSTSDGSSNSSPRRPYITPPTSDDESTPHLLRAPTCKSHRASILFTKSLPDLNQTPSVKIEDEEEVDSDVEWFAHDISDVVTLSSPLPPSFPLSATSSLSSSDLRARPDSVPPPPPRPNAPEGRSRLSKPLPNVPRLSLQGQTSYGRPSVQLDPAFPQRRKSFLIPDRPPPPPPIQVTRCSTMEEETDEMLAQLASAALGTGFLGTGLGAPCDGSSTAGSVPPSPSSGFIVTQPSHRRLPPRMSVPADVLDFSDETPWTPGITREFEVEISLEHDVTQAWPSTPQSVSIYSQASMSVGSLPTSPVSSFEFDMDLTLADGSGVTDKIPLSPANPDSPDVDTLNHPERVLRSRWSSSTLGSQMEQQAHSASWMARFNLSPSKKGKSKGSTASVPKVVPKSPISPAFKRSFDLNGGLERRGSRSSRLSDGGKSDSGDSTASSGLRRKPIPVEIFMRA
ncbi:hypothetical protein AcW1_001913 [Taiwanofungus camphoratus]|nr:hypothetical protein AcV5_000039 [Antrodia cinnamomea]KAI0945769.1 hypothetical protein AcW1_001913 [Antrodia cinnamomea]